MNSLHAHLMCSSLMYIADALLASAWERPDVEATAGSPSWLLLLLLPKSISHASSVHSAATLSPTTAASLYAIVYVDKPRALQCWVVSWRCMAANKHVGCESTCERLLPRLAGVLNMNPAVLRWAQCESVTACLAVLPSAPITRLQAACILMLPACLPQSKVSVITSDVDDAGALQLAVLLERWRHPCPT